MTVLAQLCGSFVAISVALVACAKAQPDPMTTPAGSGSAPIATATSATNPAPSGTPSAAPSVADLRPSATDAAASTGSTPEIRAGSGSCKIDADCVLSNYQEGCCVQACGESAVNRRDLAARQAKENCAKHQGPCPPPAPCPRIDYRAKSAVCRQGTCSTVVERR